MTLFDSHCHLTDERFADDLAAVLQRAWDAGVSGIVSIASSAADAVAARDIAAADPRIRCTAGLHPHQAHAGDAGEVRRIRELLDDPLVVAVGETGLDYHYDNSPRAVQRRLFDEHMRMGADTGLPVVVHSRDAEADTAAVIRAAGSGRGVLHCFTAGAALFDAAMEADWYISFAGLITFRNFDNQDLLRAAPAERLLIETDSPYLAPVPHRGQRNEPAFVAATARAAAAIRGEDEAGLAAQTTSNALRFYALEPVSPGA
jgi:TatD DNase family protein